MFQWNNKRLTNIQVIPKIKNIGCPDPSEWKYEENAAFFHYCDNETIAGIEFGFVPDVPG